MKHTKNILLLFFLIINTIYSQWVEQESGVTVDLFDVCFVDSLHGWIVGDSTTILATSDGGENWIKQHSEIEYTWYKPKIEFINNEKGFCGGANGLLLSTTDGGNTWIKNDFEFIHNISDIEFVDENNGWITAWIDYQYANDEGLILHTEDGGNSWEIQLKDTNAIRFMAIEFLDDTTGWAMGGDYFDNFSGVDFYYTNDGGVNWDKTGSFDHGPLIKLKIASKDTLWGGGFSWLSISLDGGKEWNWTTIDDYNYCFEPINGKKGWAFQAYLFTNAKRMFYTLDGGKSWKKELSLDNFINEMTSFGENNLWIVGDDGFIMKRTGSITSINEEYSPLKGFYLEQNYPNPFNPSTTISYSLPQSGFVQLKIYDMLGHEVGNLVNKEQSSGNYKVEFNASSYTSGVYFYRLQSGNFTETKKLILLR